MPFDFIYGSDEYLVEQAAKARWASVSAGLDAEFGLEIIDGRCLRVEEVEQMAKRFREATQTMGLFGGARAVWLKNVNFLTDSVVGRAEGTLTILEDLKSVFETAPKNDVRILVSATPVDKRLSFFKWLSTNGVAKETASLESLDPIKLAPLAKARGLIFAGDAAELFIKKVGTSSRAVEAELEKLSLYLNATQEKPQNVKEELVLELTSTLAVGEFFEPLEAFYSRKPAWALEAMKDYFSRKDNDVRPLIAAFFSRNRLLMLIKAAEAEGYCRIGGRGLSWTPKANALKEKMGAEKTPFNLFVQNPWYLGRLASEAGRFELKELTGIQHDLLELFEDIHKREEQTAFEAFFVKNLSGK